MMHFTHRIKDAGYKISLIFFGLSSKEDSLSRVIQRYTMGGHNVNQDVIEYNFTEGIKRVRASLPLFENILSLMALPILATLLPFTSRNQASIR